MQQFTNLLFGLVQHTKCRNNCAAVAVTKENSYHNLKSRLLYLKHM